MPACLGHNAGQRCAGDACRALAGPHAFHDHSPSCWADAGASRPPASTHTLPGTSNFDHDIAKTCALVLRDLLLRDSSESQALLQLVAADSGLQQVLVQAALTLCLPWAAALLTAPPHGVAGGGGSGGGGSGGGVPSDSEGKTSGSSNDVAAAAAAAGQHSWDHPVWSVVRTALLLPLLPELAAGMQQLLCSSSSGGTQLLQHVMMRAANILQWLPERCPGTLDAAQHAELHHGAVCLLGTLCGLLPLPRHQGQAAPQDLMPPTPPTVAQQTALGALAAVPQMAGSLHLGAGCGAADPPLSAAQLQQMCHGASGVLATATTLAKAALAEGQLRQLLAAGTASLRLLPLLARLQQAGLGSDVAVAARLLAARCLAAALAADKAVEAAQEQISLQMAAPVQPDAAQCSQELCAAAWWALQPELPQLSATVCRAVHWHAAQGAPGLLPASLLRKVPALLQDLSLQCASTEAAPSPDDRCVNAAGAEQRPVA